MSAEPTLENGVTVDFGGLELTGTLEHDEEHRALWLLTEASQEALSVNLETYGLIPDPGCVFIKDWSEHSGLAERLQVAGLVKIIRSFTVGPFSSTAFEVEVATWSVSEPARGESDQRR